MLMFFFWRHLVLSGDIFISFLMHQRETRSSQSSRRKFVLFHLQPPSRRFIGWAFEPASSRRRRSHSFDLFSSGLYFYGPFDPHDMNIKQGFSLPNNHLIGSPKEKEKNWAQSWTKYQTVAQLSSWIYFMYVGWTTLWLHKLVTAMAPSQSMTEHP